MHAEYKATVTQASVLTIPRIVETLAALEYYTCLPIRLEHLVRQTRNLVQPYITLL